ncbi:hypothetical protein [Streptomyces silvisoli]|uniref:WXG100 family type VII secretion target n=1 Tax=Streptomyces silvisoli TaxID=3034235 RepID=A0ABT5ZQD7_9ACTN|nr:hypothetical protein [Streptomyces silvisoli]MDF3292036.1 hypothetical protein [Streptomyces silvisoli]
MTTANNSGNPDLSANPEALRQAAEGLTKSINELKSVGMVGAAEIGRGFSNVSLTGLQLGNADLTSALEEFSNRWAWGVRTLIQDGDEFARALGLAAGAIHEMDQYASGTFKDLTADFIGDPNKSDTDVEKESWKTVLGDNAYTQFEHADYSRQGLDKAVSHMAKTDGAEAHDAITHSPLLETVDYASGGSLSHHTDRWSKFISDAADQDAKDHK